MPGTLLSQWWSDVSTAAPAIERRAQVVGGVLMASGAAHLVAFAVRGGPWTGPVSLRKAVTFGLAFGLTVCTLAWVQRPIALGDRLRARVLCAFTAACVVEVALVSLQAWRGVPSHFNQDSRVDSAISTTLAAGGAVIVLTTLVLVWCALRRPLAVAADRALAQRAGLLGFLFALVMGAVMVGRGVSDQRSGHAAAAYHHAGSLKPAHATTMHAILVLPLIGWLLERGTFPAAVRTRLVATAAAGYGLTAVVVLVAAVRGDNPLSPTALSGVSAFGVVVLTAVGVLALANATAVRRGAPAWLLSLGGQGEEVGERQEGREVRAEIRGR